MKQWAATVVALYIALLVALTSTLAFLCFRPDSMPPGRDWRGEDFWTFWVVVRVFWLHMFSAWPFWIVIGLLGAAQALYLVVPAKLRTNIPLAQRHVLTHVFTAGLMMAFLLEALVLAFISTMHGDEFVAYDWPNWLVWAWLGLLPWFWIWWSFVFWRHTTLMEPAAWTKLIATRLFRAGIFESLVALACHIIVRKRTGWGAGDWTFLTIAAGVAVALFAVGRGSLALRRRKTKTTPKQQIQEPALD